MEAPLNLLKDYATIDAVAEDLNVCEKTVRRRINQPDGWPFVEMGGKKYLHVPTLRKLIEASSRRRNPRRTAR